MTNAVSQITNTVTGINGLDVVNAVNGFYSTAFTHILWLLGAIITLLGITVPAVYYFLQNRQLRLKEQELAERLNQKVQEAERYLDEKINNRIQSESKEFEEKFADLKKESKSRIETIDGNCSVLSSMLCAINGKAPSAVREGCDAVVQYSIALNARSAQSISKIVCTLMERLKKEDFHDTELEDRVNKAIKSISEIEANGLLDDTITQLKNALKSAKSR